MKRPSHVTDGAEVHGVEPIPETQEVLRQLDESSGLAIESRLRALAPSVMAAVPSCVGLSITLADAGLTFTLVATAERAALLDGVQYIDGGPCAESALEGVEVEVPDMMDEQRWQHFAQAAAAQDVRSSLSLPLMRDSRTIGAVNLYAADPFAFEGRQDALRELFGAPDGLMAANADLSFRTRRDAAQAPRTLAEIDVVEQAVGFLAATHGMGVDQARTVLLDAARRAAVDAPALARVIIGVSGDGAP